MHIKRSIHNREAHIHDEEAAHGFIVASHMHGNLRCKGADNIQWSMPASNSWKHQFEGKLVCRGVKKKGIPTFLEPASRPIAKTKKHDSRAWNLTLKDTFTQSNDDLCCIRLSLVKQRNSRHMSGGSRQCTGKNPCLKEIPHQNWETYIYA